GHDGTLTVLDGTVTPTARLALTGIGLTVKNAGWPARGPAQIALEATLLGGGTLTANGTGELDQRVVRVKVGAKNVDVTQLQPYVPIRGNLQARVDAEFDVRGRLDPPRMRVRGTVGARDVALVDGGRQLLTIARIDARGVDYRAPVKLAVDEVRIVKPWALIDRNEQGQLSLRAALAAKPRSTPTASCSRRGARAPRASMCSGPARFGSRASRSKSRGCSSSARRPGAFRWWICSRRACARRRRRPPRARPAGARRRSRCACPSGVSRSATVSGGSSIVRPSRTLPRSCRPLISR